MLEIPSSVNVHLVTKENDVRIKVLKASCIIMLLYTCIYKAMVLTLYGINRYMG